MLNRNISSIIISELIPILWGIIAWYSWLNGYGFPLTEYLTNHSNIILAFIGIYVIWVEMSIMGYAALTLLSYCAKVFAIKK